MNRKSGKEFEEQFASFMERSLDVSRTATREPVKGATAVRPHDCDIHGEIESTTWMAIYWFALIGIAIGLAAGVFPERLAPLKESIAAAGQEVESALGPRVAGFGVSLIGAAGFAVALVARKKTLRHIWVECKDRKSTVKRDDINKLVAAANDVREFESADWKPTELWFAARQYDVDALNFAHKHGVRCFEAVEDSSSRKGLRFHEIE